MHTGIRSNLKAEIVRRFRSQAEFCKYCNDNGFKMTEWRLSRIIKGLIEPTDDEKQQISAFLEATGVKGKILFKLVAQ